MAPGPGDARPRGTGMRRGPQGLDPAWGREWGGERWRRAGPCGSRRHLGLIWNCSIAASRLSRMFQHSSLSGVRSHRSIRAREWAAGRCASRRDLDWRKSESRIWRPLPWRLLGNGRGAGIRGLRIPWGGRGGWVGAEVAPNAGNVARPIQGFATRRPLHCPPQSQADPDISPGSWTPADDPAASLVAPTLLTFS